jgi:hypothetical protein
MNFNDFQWISMDFYGFLKDFNGFQGISIDFNGFQRIGGANGGRRATVTSLKGYELYLQETYV